MVKVIVSTAVFLTVDFDSLWSGFVHVVHVYKTTSFCTISCFVLVNTFVNLDVSFLCLVTSRLGSKSERFVLT